MTFKIKIIEVNSETVKNGKNSYGKAEVVYDYQGQNRTQKLMSFSNPGVYKTVTSLKPGDVVEVEVTKNEKGFNQWASVKPVGNDDVSPKGSSTQGSKSTGGSWETAEERARKQLLIVKQSSLAQAVALCVAEVVDIGDVLNQAQQFTDWVMSDDAQTLDSDIEDIPV